MAYRQPTTESNQAGFTIVELLIATAIFSLVLLVAAASIVYVGRMYYKGTITNRTQDTSRLVIDDVAKMIQYGATQASPTMFARPGVATYGGVAVQAWCIGGIRYSYVTDKARGADLPHMLWKDQLGGANDPCVPRDITSATLTNGQEMLGTNMRVPLFTVSFSNGLWSIGIRIAYGDDPNDFTDNTFVACKAGALAGQFCAVSSATINVVKRL